MWLCVLAAILTGYLLGNLNGAVCVSLAMRDDVRSHGSGNAGLTNFIRSYGAGRATGVILIDAGKAFLACLVGRLLLMPYGYGLEGAAIGGLSVMLGHDFPALLGFKGGKGIPLGEGEAPVAAVREKAIELGFIMVVESETLTPSGLDEAQRCINYLNSLDAQE